MGCFEVIISHVRGWEVYFDGTIWRYTDNDKPVDDDRPCKRCGRKPVKGMDACLGPLFGVKDACCGHGVEEPYLEFKNGTRLEGKDVTFGLIRALQAGKS